MNHLDPRNYSWANNSTIYKWRSFLKVELLKERHFRSDWSGELLRECHAHEGILPRCVIPKSVSWAWMLFSPENTFLLLPEEHIPQAPSREWCIEKSFELYGRLHVITWFNSLPWKVPPFKIENY